MNVEQLLEKIREIKLLATDINTDDSMSEKYLNRIIAICEDVEIDYQIEQRLQNEHTTNS